jgi:hypothetical protein
MNTTALNTTASWKTWVAVQVAGVITTVVILVGLLVLPELSLGLLWNVAIPLVPATLLLSPLIWRNACPLATINMLSNRRREPQRASPKWVYGANLFGIALFALLVPARRFLFNTDGVALFATVIAVAILALLLGALFDARAGFCNAICPVLPVERIYGQSPLIDMKRGRCSTCTACINPCLDLSPERNIHKLTRGRSGATGFLTTPTGAFAAALPGFIWGYFALVDGPLATAGTVYATIAAWCVVSYLVTFAVVGLVKPDSTLILRVLGGAAAGIYYWFATPGIAEAIGAPVSVGVALRVLALTLVAVWLRFALAPRMPAAAHSSA